MNHDATPGIPPAHKAPLPLEMAIDRVLQEARMAKMTERDPHYRYLLTILTLSHRTQQLASNVMESAESFRQTHEKMQHDWSEFGKCRDVQAPPAYASPPQAKPGDDLKALAWVIGIAVVLFFGGYKLGEREVFWSRYTPVDRLRQVFNLDDLSVKILRDLIPLNDLHQIAATCKARAYYRQSDDRLDCNVTLVVPPDLGR